MESRNPATGKLLERFEPTSPAEAEAALDAGQQAFREWRCESFTHRAAPMMVAAQFLRSRKQSYARTMALEMGKPVTQGEAEVEKCAWVCEYYAENAERFLSDEPRESDASESFLRFEPLGVILGIMPWNYPMWQVFRFLAPALMAGNAGILKHAPNVSRSALEIEALLLEAGFPAGLFRALLVEVDVVGDLIADERVAAVTLTGSEFAGTKVAEASGREIKKTVLELGGSDPFIILDDADLDRAAAVGADARLVNAGQSCIAAKRFIVVDAIADEFTEKFTRNIASRKMGDPLDPLTELGPLARPDLRDNLHRQVSASIRQGGRCLTGGVIPDGPGVFYPPTVITGVAAGMPVADEEIFGPVAAIIRVRDDDEAVSWANRSRFGLAASLWTRDLGRARRLVPQIEAGTIFVNSMVRSDPRLPFGGIKRSGYGRELSEYGIREFVNVKTVCIS